MKLLISLSFFIISYTYSYADTLDYYHVYHNEIKIAEYNSYNLNDSTVVLNLSKDSIKTGDRLEIKYFRDFVWLGTLESINIEVNEIGLILKSTLKGRKHSFELTDIITLSKEYNTNKLLFNYNLTDNNKINIKNGLFVLVLIE